MNRLAPDQPLAKFSTLDRWVPKVGDFITYHAIIWSRWYGIVRFIHNDELTIIREGLVKMLLTTPPGQYDKYTIMGSVSEIKSSSGGKYAVLQDGVWHID